MENVTIIKNLAYIAGGIYNVDSASPAFTSGSISGNKALSHAGGMYNVSSSMPTLTNMELFGNSAVDRGGAIYNKTNSNPILTNLTISGNKAGDGGAIYNESSSSPTVRNSILYGNTKTNGTTVNNVVNHPSNGTPPQFSYSLVQGSGGSGNWNMSVGNDLGNNLEGNPMLTDAPNGDYTLSAGSSAINAGSDSFYATGQTPNLNCINTDLAGKPRFNGTIDVGAYEYEGTLPVSLTNFTAKTEINGAKLSWQTASEQSNQSFTISRSIDGVNFTAIGTVNSNGNGNSLTNYAFVDFSPSEGTNYYRLQQTDTDGKTTDLRVRSVVFKLSNTEVAVYPNPTADFASVKFATGLFNQVTIVDLSGKVLIQQVINSEQTEVKLDLSAYKTGTYIIRLTGRKKSSSHKVIKL